MSWLVASEGLQRAPKRGISGSHGLVTPAGQIHAVDSASRAVACGLPFHELALFEDLEWARSTSPFRCRHCTEVVARDLASA